MIVGASISSGGTDLTSSESGEGGGESCDYLKSGGSGRQDLHESGRHSEDEGEKVMLAGSKWRLTPRSWSWPVILDEDSRWREHTVVEWITIDLKARWRIVGYAFKSQDWKSEYCRFCGKICF
ncbi:hypothetical protein QL285_085136 [Trifolium repens]|nr:hypothetical protein QL285_085136 [Trifolium repens]